MQGRNTETQASTLPSAHKLFSPPRIGLWASPRGLGLSCLWGWDEAPQWETLPNFYLWFLLGNLLRAYRVPGPKLGRDWAKMGKKRD